DLLMYADLHLFAARPDIGAIDIVRQQRIRGVEPAAFDDAAHRHIDVERSRPGDRDIRWAGGIGRSGGLLLGKTCACLWAVPADPKAAEAYAAARQQAGNRQHWNAQPNAWRQGTPPHLITALVAEVHILQGKLYRKPLDVLDHRLQIVPLLPRHPEFVPLYCDLDFIFAVLDFFHDPLGQLPVDPLPDQCLLPDRLTRCLLHGLVVEHPKLDLAPRQVPLQQLVHLLELQLVVRVDGDFGVLPFDAGLGPLEVVALAHLARHIGERVVDLGKIGL